MTRGASIFEGLLQRGFKPHVAEAFMDSFQAESGLDGTINEAEPLVEGSRGGRGLYQLTGSRRDNYEAEYGTAYDDSTQLDFLANELLTTERAAADAINNTTNRSDAVKAITSKFLRPAVDNSEHRINAWKNGEDMNALIEKGGTKNSAKLSEFATEQGKAATARRDESRALAADSNAFEQASFGVMTGLLSPEEAQQFMADARRRAEQNLARANQGRDTVATVKELSDGAGQDTLAGAGSVLSNQQQSSPIPMMRPAAVEASANLSPYNGEGDTGFVAGENTGAPDALFPLGGETQEKVETASTKEEKDPWNWKLGLADGLSALGLGMAQAGSGQTANVQSVVNRRAQINQFKAQQKRLKDNAAQAQSNSDRNFGLAQYSAKTGRINALKPTGDAPVDPSRYAGPTDSTGGAARKHAAGMAMTAGKPALAALIEDDETGFEAARYLDSPAAHKGATGAQLEDVTKANMQDGAAALRQQYEDGQAVMSPAERQMALTRVLAVEDAANSDNPTAYKAAVKDYDASAKVAVDEGIAAKEFSNDMLLAQEQSRLRDAEAPEEVKTTQSYIDKPELLETKLKIAEAAAGGSIGDKAKLGVIAPKIKAAQDTYSMTRKLERVHKEIRTAVEALGPNGTGPLHSNTLTLRKMVGELGLGEFLPKDFQDLSSEQKLASLNSATIRLERASGEGTMTDRDAQILSMINAGLDNTYLGNLLLMQVKEGQNDYDKAHSSATVNFFNQGQNVDEMTNLAAKEAYFEERGVNGYTGGVPEVRRGATIEQRNAAFSSFEETARDGHLLMFKTKTGEDMFYQKGGRVFDSAGNVVIEGGN